MPKGMGYPLKKYAGSVTGPKKAVTHSTRHPEKKTGKTVKA
jgi:hypothetical protein